MTNPVVAQVSLASKLKEKVLSLGFHQVGIAPAVEADGFARLQEWIREGAHAGMEYMARHALARRHPESVLNGVKSVVMAAMSYRGPLPDDEHAIGKVARYARGPDYHETIRERLGHALEWIVETSPGAKGRVVADTAPLMERDFARRAGLGWIGRNTMLINPRMGSFTVLGAILLDIPLTEDAPFIHDRCGSCTACVKACPTGALAPHGWLDARKCISYWTIEHRGEGPDWIPDQLEGWIFGCDICQEACPWNRKAFIGETPLGQDAGMMAIDPGSILEADDATLRSMFRESAMWRARPQGLRRNALWLIGSRGDSRDLPKVCRFVDDPDSGIRSAARWAKSRLEPVQ